MRLLGFAIRSHRTGAVAAAVIGALGCTLNGIGYGLDRLLVQIAYLLPTPVQLDTLRHLLAQQLGELGVTIARLAVGGYPTWRNFGLIALAYTAWAVLAGTGASSGDEDSGLMEAWLGAGISRPRWLLVRSAGFLLALLFSLTVAVAVVAAGAAIAGQALPADALALEGVAVLALAQVGFGIGVGVAQLFVTRRGAAFAGGALVLILFLLDAAGRSGIHVGVLRVLSPFSLFDRSTPLLVGGGLDAAATAALFGAAAALVALGTVGFARRDLAASVPTRGTEPASESYVSPRDPPLGAPVLGRVEQQRLWIAGWAVGAAALAFVLTWSASAIIEELETTPGMGLYLRSAGILTSSEFVLIIWYSSALLILPVFVLLQVNGWATGEDERRVDAVLAAGASRTRVVLERVATLLVDVAIIAAVGAVVVAIAAGALHLGVPTARLAAATVLLLPVTFALGSLGHLLVARRPRLAVLVLGALTLVVYYADAVAPSIGRPAWLTNASIFALYAGPLTSGDWSGTAALVAIGLFGTAAALAATRRRDVA